MAETRTLISDDVEAHEVAIPGASGQQLDGEKKDQSREKVAIQALHFIDRPEFRVAISIIVFLNILEVAAETDFPTMGIWIPIDNGFLLIYLAELALRIGHHGVWFFIGKDRWWAMIDVALAVLGIIDLWVVAPASGWRSEIMEQMRLLRVLRAIRIFKLLPKLTAFLSALVSMLGAFIWVFLVLFLTLLAASLFLTNLIQVDGLLEDVPSDTLSVEERDATKAKFQSVCVSLFTLFRVVTQDNWIDIAGPLNAAHPRMRFFFVAFIAFASWTLISVLTGVASDEMIAATSNRKEEERLEQERRQKTFIEFLRKSFYDADADGNNVLDKDEFESLMQEPSMQQTMQGLGLDMTLQELSKAWSMLDVDGSGELTIDDFVEGLSYLQETLSVKHIISVDYSVKRTSVRLEKCLDHLLEELVQVGRQSEMITAFLTGQEEKREKISEELAVWRSWARLSCPEAVSSKRKEQGTSILRSSLPPKPLPVQLTPRNVLNASSFGVICTDVDGVEADTRMGG